QSANGALLKSKCDTVVRNRSNRAIHENPSGLDAAPPGQRIEVVLRLDDFVQLEQKRELIKRVAVVTDVGVRDDDPLARRDIERGANRIDDSECSEVLRTRDEVPRYPSQNLPIAIEIGLLRSVDNDDFEIRNGDFTEVSGEVAQLVQRAGRAVQQHHVAASTLGRRSVS